MAAASRSRILSRISPAALRVKVVAKMALGGTPSLKRWMKRLDKRNVFPVPAEARINKWLSIFIEPHSDGIAEVGNLRR